MVMVLLVLHMRHQLIKRPRRDTCLYLGERGERVGPPAPAFSIARQPLGRFSSNLAHVCISPVKNF